MSSEETRFKVGDVIRFSGDHHAAGDIGVITAEEVWIDEDTPIKWDGTGERPVWSGDRPDLCANSPRFLVKLTEEADRPEGVLDSLRWWRDMCRQEPHNYPYAAERDMELVSREN